MKGRYGLKVTALLGLALGLAFAGEAPSSAPVPQGRGGGRVLSAVLTPLPAQLPGADLWRRGEVELCWTSDTEGAGYRIYAGPEGRPPADFKLVETLPASQRCWRGADPEETDWAVASVTASGLEGERALASREVLRRLGSQGHEAFLPSATVHDLAEYGGQLWIASDGGLSAAPVTRPESSPWTTLSGESGPGFEDATAAHVDPDGAWVGGQGRVSRYDPRRGLWRRWGSEEGVPQAQITVLLQGPAGVLAGAAGGEVVQYRAGADTWETVVTALPEALPADRLLGVDAQWRLWFSTSQGIRCYDYPGKYWEKPARGERATTMVTDPDGHLWFGTAGDGLLEYAPDRGLWTAWAASAGPGDDHVSALRMEDRHLWVGTASGLAMLDLETRRWSRAGDPDAPPAVRRLDGLPVTRLHRDANGALWVAVEGEGLRRVLNETMTPFRPATALTDGPVYAMASPLGEQWFAGENGVSRLSTGRGQWAWWRAIGPGLKGPYRAMLLSPSDQAVWVGGTGGVARYLPEQDRWQTFPLEDPEERALSLAAQGASILVGTDRGLRRLDRATGILAPDPRVEKLEDIAIQALLADTNGSLWIGTALGAWQVRADGTLDVRPADGAVSGKDVLAIEQDLVGALWFGTRDGQAIRYLRGSGELQLMDTPDGAAILDVARDTTGVWIVSETGLLFWDSAASAPRLEPRLSAPAARAVSHDGLRGMWLATERGLLRWEPSQGLTRRFPTAVRDPAREARTLAVAKASAGRVWIGDAAGRVSLVDAEGDVITQMGASDGLPAGEVRALLAQPDQTLWIGKYGGGVTRVRMAEDPRARVIEPLRGPIGPGDDAVTGLTLGENGQPCALFEGGASCLGETGWAPLRAPRGVSGAVHALLYDSRGRWWFGAEGGAGWRAGEPNNREAAGLVEELGQGVTAFLEDATGTVWVGTMEGGVARLSRGGSRFSLDLSPLEHLTVQALHMAGGQLWIGTDKGVFTRPAPEIAAFQLKGPATRSPEDKPEGSREWTRVTELDLGSGTEDVRAIVSDGDALWFATLGGALRWEAGEVRRVRPPPLRGAGATPPLLGGAQVGLPLTGVAALVQGDQLLGEPSMPAAIVGAVRACPGHATREEIDLLLDTGELMRLPGSAGARDLLSPPVDAPASLAALCDPESAQSSLTLCVGGALGGRGALACRTNALPWEPAALPVDPTASVTALVSGADRTIWAGLSSGAVCRLHIDLGGEARDPRCIVEGLPLGAVSTLAEDGEGGAWIGSAAGLAHVQVGPDGALTQLDLPRATPPDTDYDLSQLYESWSRSPVRALVFDPSATALWLAGETWSLVRVGKPARRSLNGRPVPPVQMVKRGGDPMVAAGGLAMGEGQRLWVLRDNQLYDYDARVPTRSMLRQVALGLTAALSALLALGATLVFRSPTVRAFRRDPSSIERVPLDHLAMDLRLLRLAEPGFGRATIGTARMTALRRLAASWGDDTSALLLAAAEVLDVEPASDVTQDALTVRLAALGLALKRPDTLLMTLPAGADPQVALRERLTALGFHELVPALVIWRGEEPPALHGAVVLSEPDLRGLAWDRNPRRRLASLLWQRSDLQGLSPYQAHGAVADPRMFFGRDAVLRELTASGRRRALLVIGPRKVGKTSVLVRAAAELERRGSRTLYVTLRATVAGPYDLAVALARAARVDPPAPPEAEGPAAEAALLGSWIREHLAGANLLMDEADAFLRNDRAGGSAASEELRALVQEGVCALALAGYGTLYRAALSQSETAYNLGEPLYIGPLEREAALRLAVEPMERMGIRWVDPSLPTRLVEAVGCLAHLVQEACRRLLLRVRGFREPELNSNDLNAVLGDWRPPGEPASLRELLINNVETNLKGPAQAAVWLLADERGEGFSLSELDQALRGAGFDDLDSERIIEVGLALQMSGVCSRGADRYRFLMPLLGQAVEDLDVSYRVSGLKDAWRALDPAARRAMRFWGGED